MEKINPFYKDYKDKVAPQHKEYIGTPTEEYKLWLKIREIGELGRRTGTGITALGDFYAALGLEYGNEAITNEIFSLKLQAELDASIDMAILRGAFPLWDSKKEYANNTGFSVIPQNDWYDFIWSHYPTQAERMINFGRRNSGLSTCAPVGTGSLMTGTTSGIEPLFMPYYTRRKKCNPEEKPDFIDQNGVGYKEYTVIHPKFKEWYIIAAQCSHCPEIAMEAIKMATKEDLEKIFKESPWYNQTANDIDWKKRIDTQSIIQKYITSSISSTINLPETVSKDIVENIYLRAFEKGLKGVTVYRDKSRSGILVNSSDKVESNRRAKKRPRVLEADYWETKAKGEQYIVLIGLLDGKPYEVFTFKPLNPVSIKPHKGRLTKIKKGQYSFDSEFINITDLQLANTNELEKACSLYTSMLLREGSEIDHVINVAKKIDDNIVSFVSAMCRILSKYITKDIIKDEICPECGGRLIKENGCTHCIDCTYSKCG